MNSASVIKEARLRAGLSQTELADRLGTTQSAIARWEAGRANPSADALGRVVAACGLELRASLVEVDPMDAISIERTLTLTPEQRFDELVRTVAFIHSGRRALGALRG